MSDKKVPEVKELFPPEGDPEVAEKVFAILDEVIKDKVSLGLHKKWSRNYEMFEGKHWRNKANVPLVEANLVYRHVQQTVNQLTDNNPTFNVSKSGEYEEKIYEDIQRAATHWWTDQEQQDILESSVRNGEIYGIAIEKVVFNAELEYGLGEVETVIVDPFHFGWYPTKLRDPREIQKCMAVFHYYPMTVREARRRWPGVEIKADQTIIKDLEDERRNVNSEVGSKPKSTMVSLASVAKEILNWKTGDQESDDDELIIVEAWVHDYTEETRVEDRVIESVTIDGVETPTVVEKVEITDPKYPGNIRYIVCCNGKTTLEDRPNPNVNMDVLSEEEARKTYLFDKFPFVAVNSVRDTSNAWGISDIEQLEKLNMEMNKAISQMVLEKDRAVRRKWINPITSGVPNDHFTNFTSVLNPVDEKTGDGIRVVDYPAPPMDIQAAITLFKDIFFLVSATFELDQAQMGNNQLAYKAIAALIERVATMMRGKIRAYGRLIRERGRMYISHVQNFYTEDRWITYEDEKGIETVGNINGRNLVIPAKLTVVNGSTLPTSKVQQREESVNLFTANAIDRQELLSKLEWSGRAEVIERMNAGVIGMAVKNLQMLGFPPQLLQFLQEIESKDPKELAQAVKAGQVPMYQQLMQMMIDSQSGKKTAPEVPPLDQAEVKVKEAEVAVKQATVRKTEAETSKTVSEQALILEKINTEKVEQHVKLKGIEYDDKTIKLDTAKTVSEIARGAKDNARPSKNRPGYNEKGMKSNNRNNL